MTTMLMVAGTGSMIEQFNMNNIRLLLRMGIRVDVACNFKEGNTFSEKEVEDLKRRLTEMGVPFYQIDFSRNVTDLKGDRRAFRQILTLLQEKQYTFVHVHMPIVSVLVRAAAHRTRTKAMYTAHGFHFYKGAPKKNWLLYYPIEKFCSKWTDVLITINREDYARAQAKFRAKATVYIPGVGIDTSRFLKDRASGEEAEKVRAELGIPEDALWMLSVGELNENKNQQVVLKALHELKGERSIFYTIAGQGKQKEHLEALIREFGLEESVKLLGFRTDIARLYKAADLFVHPSYREGLSVALMEAMASGLPVAAGRIRGNTDLIVEGKGGALFDPASEADCAGRIRELTASTEQLKEMGDFNRIRIEEFDIRKVNVIMEQIYRKISGIDKVRPDAE